MSSVCDESNPISGSLDSFGPECVTWFPGDDGADVNTSVLFATTSETILLPVAMVKEEKQ